MRISIVPRLTRPRLALAGVSLAVAGSLLGAGLAGSATAATTATTATTAKISSSAVKPTIVLVHGAWADNSSWDGVVERLQALGYPVVAAPNPLRGVTDDSDYLSDFLSTISGPIVLVGHSYGGFVITNAATGNPQVKALVYDDAFIPAAGDTAQTLTGDQPGSCLAADPATVLNFAPYPNAPSGDADAYVKPGLFPGCFANGLPAGEGAALAAEQEPVAVTALNEKLANAPAWQTIPSWAVFGTADKVIPPAELLAMAQRAGSQITEIPGAPHLSMISNPGAVTSVILAASAATAS